MPVLAANDLTDLGRLGLAHTTEADASRARDAELASHMLQSVAQNRLAQQQLAQQQQHNSMATALALAQIQQQSSLKDQDFAHALALQKAENDARTDMLSKQLQNALDVAKINASKLDPSLAGGILQQGYTAEQMNRDAEATAAQANALQAVEDQKSAQLSNSPLRNKWINWIPGVDTPEDLKIAHAQRTAAILADPSISKNAHLIKYDPTIDPVTKRPRGWVPITAPVPVLPNRGVPWLPAPAGAAPTFGAATPDNNTNNTLSSVLSGVSPGTNAPVGVPSPVPVSPALTMPATTNSPLFGQINGQLYMMTPNGWVRAPSQ